MTETEPIWNLSNINRLVSFGLLLGGCFIWAGGIVLMDVYFVVAGAVPLIIGCTDLEFRILKRQLNEGARSNTNSGEVNGNDKKIQDNVHRSEKAR